ncbi:hypothetical protein ACN1T8_003800 [Vibrio cholerae]|uniref:hypothetical protein n=1 Tax=Vibrio cholerae TaxID=666 RepID=UPI001C92DBE1|nr:hypothetical protein [Vibrio cholerae]ELJ8564019.1 hypothetical protein [Vibrio cholerae]MBY4642193.1 hypothetical protein [Vibrio cholerae]MCR9658465.1 hypothetical protein [Vibrio cholerae]MCR9689147.1 hypothetical protein [Vibrio cholerae]MCR9746478.1 hypothetical protein [Vibrio cholerae]
MPKSVELYIKAKAGRRANGNSADAGTVYHALLGNGGMHSHIAICGEKPSKEWGEWEGGEVTCERCLTRLRYINYQKAKVNQEDLDPWFRE